MTDDAARRERACAWAREAIRATDFEPGLLFINAKDAYLAGAREEAELNQEELEYLRSSQRLLVRERDERDAEIAALQQNDANREALLDSLLRLRNEQILEIAALREFVRWHFMHHPQSWPGNAEIMPAVRRALEGQP